MKTKSRRFLYTLMAVMLVFGMFAAPPLTARADNGPFQVTENPVGAIYVLNQAAVPIKAIFEYDALAEMGTIDSAAPIKVQWYWSSTNSNTGRTNGFGEQTIEYSRKIKHQTTLTPVTNTAGVRYYYAVITFRESVATALGSWESVPRETATEPARIEVIAPSSATISPESVTFEKGGSGDITLTVYTAGYLAQSIKNGDYTLVAGTDFIINNITSVTLNASYLNTLDVGTHTLTFNFSGGTSPTLTITVTAANVAPTITGPTTMTLTQGYAAISTDAYTITGTPAPTVTKTSGNAAILWNDSTKRLEIAAGLSAGTYPVVLTATNAANTATLTFTLTVTAAGTGSMSNFVKSKTYSPGMFSDVNENQWYGYTQQKVIASAYEYGLMQGSGNTFNPTGNMTIAEAVTIAARVHHIYNGGNGEFTQGSPWYQVYVDYCIGKGIVNAGTFSDYNKAATRAEMAYIFSRALPETEFSSQNTVNALPDVTSSTPYYSAIITLYKAGVVAGSDTQGTYNPGNNITRAEAAAIISRVILKDTRFSGKTFG